jgi:hypothetical protein
MEEIQVWHSRLRDHSNFQTMQAHMALVGAPTSARKTTPKVKVDMSDFV